MNERPKISVVVLTPDCYATIRQTMRCLCAQTICDDIEVVVVAPSKECLIDDRGELGMIKHQVVEVGPIKSTAAARATGVRRACAAVIAFAEDHSFPAADWAENLVASHQGPWAAVGPAMCNANPREALSWTNLAIEYGLWLDPVPSGPVDHLPGHNSSYKRDLLLDYGDELEAMLEAESILHWDLRAKGNRLYLNAKAKTYHLNYSLLRPTLVLRFLGGRLFAAARGRKWPFWHRLLFGLGSPLIPFRRGHRIVRDLRRAGHLSLFKFQILFLLPLGLAADAFGEMWGYFFGGGQAMAGLTEMEFKRHRFMKRGDIAEIGDRRRVAAAVAE
jgi:hypothetical protein